MKVKLTEKFAQGSAHGSPRIVADLNGQRVKLVKFRGVFDWRHHAREDELFLVHRHSMVMEFRDRRVTLAPGEFLVVPRGIGHRPVAEHEVEVVIFEPVSTLNTGNVRNDRAVPAPERL
ncbi:MAG: cupin domain-containing protein [Phycisphaerae bacterium]|nr:cupin domain-containing protein [Phycisphaerae bacterium]